MLLSACIEIVERDIAALDRWESRRERFIDCLDWTMLTPELARVSSMADDWIAEEMADASLYLEHLMAWIHHAGDLTIAGPLRFSIPARLTSPAAAA